MIKEILFLQIGFPTTTLQIQQTTLGPSILTAIYTLQELF